jgi:Fe-S cluster assembly iron-binding protein IscA
MLTVTAQAAEKLKTRAEAEIADPSQAFRLVPARSGGIALVVDTVKEEDQVVEHEGVVILLVGAELADTVDGLVLDCKDTPQGRRLTISGPSPEA